MALDGLAPDGLTPEALTPEALRVDALAPAGGVAICLKSADGEIVWQERIGGNHSASPVMAEGRIYFTNEEGESTIIEASPTFKVLAKNSLGEKTQASMAISQKQIFIRTAQNLFCIAAK